jgi:ABC-type dipeptide/oligopeptide/nickel transport system permease subunit
VDNIILIISLLTWMSMSRLVRAETLSVKEREYVLYARASGRTPAAYYAPIIPGVLPTIIVAATRNSVGHFDGIDAQLPRAWRPGACGVLGKYA